MRFVGRAFRGHDPAWSFSPLSGEGAAHTGGRFNRKGDPALYLATGIMTAVRECTQGLGGRLLPITLCEYDIDCEDVVDLSTDAARRIAGVGVADLACGWLTVQSEGRSPPSRLVAARMKAAGHSGMLSPSFVPGSTPADINLVLWRWGDELPCQVRVHDPTGRLPKNQTSWPTTPGPGP